MSAAPAAIGSSRALVRSALQECVGRLEDPGLQRIAAYQLGWCDPHGRPTAGHSGKAVRPALALIGARAVGGEPEEAVWAAAAVELVHNFSLLHDDVMDGDIERRHRQTGWAAFGEGPALLAGNAMLVAAIEALMSSTSNGDRALAALLRATQRLINGQAEDLRLETAGDVTIDDVLHMAGGKTGALLECAASIGAIAVGADDGAVSRLAGYGRQLGLAFQMVDDVLGIVGKPAVTGKSSSSDLRAGKRTAPIVAALNSGDPAGDRLASLLRGGPLLAGEDVALAAKLVDEAGGIRWAAREAESRLHAALAHLAGGGLQPEAVADLVAIALYVVDRDR